MVITAQSGPHINFGTVVSASGATQEYNEERGPSLNDLGVGLMDPRFPYSYQPGDPVGAPVVGLYNNQGIVDQVPSTVSSRNILTKTTSFNAGVALSLNTSMSSAGFTPNVSLVAPELGTVVTVSVIDGSTGVAGFSGASTPTLTFGSAGTVAVWNPAMGVARALVISPSSQSDGGTFTIAGRDIYGQKMTESITAGGAGSTTLLGQKAFKYITSIIACTTVNSTSVQIGTQDVFGFPVRLDSAGYANVWWGPSSQAALVAVSSGKFTYALGSTVTSVSTGVDVRGTLSPASTLASNSTGSAPTRLQMFVGFAPQNVATVTSSQSTGLFGTQSSSV